MGLGADPEQVGGLRRQRWVPGAGLKLPERHHNITRAVGRGRVLLVFAMANPDRDGKKTLVIQGSACAWKISWTWLKGPC